MNNEIIITNHNPQDITITQDDNQLIFINGGGEVIGITDVKVNGESVVTNNVAYVIVPTKTSELTNDSGFITSETDPTVPSYVKAITLADITNWNNKQNTLVSGNTIKTINNETILGSGNINIEGTTYTAGTGINIENNIISNEITNYNDLTDLPDIPTKTSDLLNDSNYVTSEDLSEVAFDGSYTSLSNTPTIPDSTSQLVNDSGFIDNTVNDLTNYLLTTDINTALGNKQDSLVSGTNIKTINNTSLLGSGNINVGSGITLLDVYPVGSIYMSVNNTSPATLFGGTWEQLQDRFLLGAGTIYTAGNTGGEATHTLTTNEMPSHFHNTAVKDFLNQTGGSNSPAYFTVLNNSSVSYNYGSGVSNSFDNALAENTGGGQAHNNLPPYLVVNIWKRTA